MILFHFLPLPNLLGLRMVVFLSGRLPPFFPFQVFRRGNGESLPLLFFFLVVFWTPWDSPFSLFFFLFPVWFPFLLLVLQGDAETIDPFFPFFLFFFSERYGVETVTFPFELLFFLCLIG